MKKEEWKICIGFPSFSISNRGRVKRSSNGLQKWSKAGRVLTVNIDKDGYWRYSLCEKGIKTRRSAHQLVCEAWHGSRPSPKHMALHRDDIKSNNTPKNIYWGTIKHNGADSVRNGRSVRGERVNTARLTEIQIIEIRKKSKLGQNNCMLAREYGIPNGSISSIVRGKSWKHVGGPRREKIGRGVRIMERKRGTQNDIIQVRSSS